MICVSEDSACEPLAPGLRLPRSSVLPSPDAIAKDEASRPMITADDSTRPVRERSLRNMGWNPPCLVSCLRNQLGHRVKVAVACPHILTVQRIVSLIG